MLKYIKVIVIIICLINVLILPQIAFAQNRILAGLDVIEEPLGMGSKDLRIVAAELINEAVALLGILSVVIVILSGFMWMLAGGDDEKVGKAKKTLVSGLIGLVLIIVSFSLANFIISSLLSAVSV